MRYLVLIGFLLLSQGRGALAEIKFPSSKSANNLVTILSDGISEPNGLASQTLNQIAVALDKDGDIRVLSINGYGGAVNIRDLLQLRGADFAIVNNDVLSYLDLARSLPEAKRRVKLVAPLFHQSVLLFARQNVKSIDDLSGRKVGISSSRPSRGITAKTILGLMKISAEFIEVEDRDLARRAETDLDAVLMFESDLPDLRSLGVTPNNYHLLPIPPAGPLAQTYLPKRVKRVDLQGFVSDQGFETVEVTTVLAAFDWTAKQGRYPEVLGFVRKLFALLPTIRAQNPESPLARTDVRIDLPGWQRFGPAASLAAAAAPAPAPYEGLSRATSAAASPATDALRIVVIGRPPLTNSAQTSGGVALKLFTDALQANGAQTTVQWVDGERTILESLVSNKSADVGLFWQTPNCDAPSDQSATEAALCDRAVLSNPIMQAVIGVFTRIDASLDPKGADQAPERTICIPDSQPLPANALEGISWVKPGSVKTIRPKTLIDCIAAVDRREADAFAAIEPEGRFVITKLKLSESFQLSQRLKVTTGLHAIVAKENPRQEEIVRAINDALARFMTTDRYAADMAAHLAELTGAATKVP